MEKATGKKVDKKTPAAKNGKTTQKSGGKKSASKASSKSPTLAGKKLEQFLDRSLISYFDHLAEHYDISRVARGLEKPESTDLGFLPRTRRLFLFCYQTSS